MQQCHLALLLVSVGNMINGLLQRPTICNSLSVVAQKKKIPHCQFGKLLLVAKKVMSDMDFDEN